METSTKVAIGVVIAAIIALFIPCTYWDGSVPSGRYIQTGKIVEKQSGAIIVQITGPTKSESYLYLTGDIPTFAYIDETVQLGYADYITADPHQTVAIAYEREGNLLIDGILRRFSFGERVRDLKLSDMSLDGTVLKYGIKN